ncbi:MAG: O-antigen ligase family protein [Pseudomonadota bacterium]
MAFSRRVAGRDDAATPGAMTDLAAGPFATEVDEAEEPAPAKARRPALPQIDFEMPDAQGALFWLAAIAVLVAALALGANRPVSWLTLSVVALVLFAAQVVLDVQDSRAAYRWRRLAPVVILYLGVVTWAAFQALPAPLQSWAHPAWAQVAGVHGSISADPGMTWQGVLRFLGYAAIFWVALRGAADRERAKAFIAVFALFSGILAFFGLLALNLGQNPIVGKPFYETSVTASFVNRNAYALYAGFGAMACLATLGFRLRSSHRDSGGPKRRALRDFFEMLIQGGWVYMVSFFVIAVALVNTESRAGTAVSLVGIATILAIILARGGGIWRLSIWAAVIVPLVAASLVAGGLGQRLLLTDPLTDGRLAVNERTMAGIEAAPWLGHGLGSFQDAFRPYATPDIGRAEWDLAHNAYLENAFELGVPATLALLLAVALIGLRLIRGVRERRRMRAAPGLALAVLLAGALHSVVDFSLQMPATAAMLAMILGVGWAQSVRGVPVRDDERH